MTGATIRRWRGARGGWLLGAALCVSCWAEPGSEAQVVVERAVKLELEPAPMPDAREGAKARREEGKAGKKGVATDRQIAENSGVLGSLRERSSVDGLFDLGSPTGTPVVRNRFERTVKDGLSTFSIDVDTASYTQVRRMLRAGTLPPAGIIRTEEFVNALDYRYPRPEAGVPFAVTLEGAEHPWTPGHHVLRVGIQGAEPEVRRAPVHLTLLIDTSCSMQPADRLPLAKEALHHLVDRLGPRDSVAIATYAGRSEVVMPPTQAEARWTIHKGIDRLTTAGGTAMEEGMKLAYQLADDAYVPGEENRVIVLSDGDANIGADSHEAILASLRRWSGRGITLSTVGFGTGNYRDGLMEQLADNGDGNYAYIDTLDEAKRVLGTEWLSTVQTIARDVKVQVAFDPDQVLAYRLVGYENRALADRDFRDDRVDAGEVGAGHTVTALYDVVLADHLDGMLADVRVRAKPPGPDASAREIRVQLPAIVVDRPLEHASDDLRLAWGMASFAEKLRRADELAEVPWSAVRAMVESGGHPGSERDDEVLELLDDLVATEAGVAAQRARWAELEEELADSPATVRPGEAIVLGAVDRSDIDAVIGDHDPVLRGCHHEALQTDPGARGQLVVKFTIAQDGTVSAARPRPAASVSDAIATCVVGAVEQMRFPAPVGGGIAIVAYPLEFGTG